MESSQYAVYEENYFARNKKRLVRYGWYGLAAVIFLLLLANFKILILLPLIAANVAVSWFRRKITISWFGLEIILLTTVFSGAAFGSVAGMVMGVLCIFINYALSRKNQKYFFLTVPLYALVGFAASFVPLEHLVGWGIFITFIYNIVSFFISRAVGAKTAFIALFCFTNIAFNMVFFIRLGPLLAGWVGA